MTNHEIAERLLEYARGLPAGANLYRVRAYRRAAMALDALDRTVHQIGRKQLAQVPSIGPHLAFTIDMLARTGEFVTFPVRRSIAA